MEILRTNYHQRLTLNKHNNNFYTIDFSNKTIGFTLLTASTINDIQNKWNNLLNSVYVKTPVESLNILMNGWLPYQTI